MFAKQRSSANYLNTTFCVHLSSCIITPKEFRFANASGASIKQYNETESRDTQGHDNLGNVTRFPLVYSRNDRGNFSTLTSILARTKRQNNMGEVNFLNRV